MTKTCVAAKVVCLIAAPSYADIIPIGAGQQVVAVEGVPLTVFTYWPAGCAPRGLLIVLHGLDRNAYGYRDHARPLADRACLIVAAPLFDAARFPTWRYQHGGVRDHAALQPERSWTGDLVAPLAAALLRAQGTPGQPFYLIGHSAGAQFLSRVAAYTPNGARRIVIANPSTYVLPSLDDAPPYGFERLKRSSDRLRAYLAQPVTLLLGNEDTGSKNLAEDAAAERQGATRIERGERTFAAAREVARAHGWAFNWRLITVPGVGHSARSMFASEQAVQALEAGDSSNQSRGSAPQM